MAEHHEFTDLNLSFGDNALDHVRVQERPNNKSTKMQNPRRIYVAGMNTWQRFQDEQKLLKWYVGHTRQIA